MSKSQNFIDISTHIGCKIKETRKKAGITLEQVSRILGITYQQLQKYESGNTCVPVEKLYDISVIFNIPIQYFFEGIKAADIYSQTLYNEELIERKTDSHLNIFIIDSNPEDEFITRKVIHEIDKEIEIFCIQNESNVINNLKRKELSLIIPVPDLIFMDINISKQSYHLLISEIKKEKYIQEIPLIILTHSVRVEDLLKVYKNGAASFIYKSLDFEIFKKDMKICLEYWSKVVTLPSVVKRDSYNNIESQ
ncbi:MAG: helix-turn-helix domain-containing protein [Holosporales bacterium]|jgi:transcriptional regulator with XRE-family HTH domain|nr:helix-turn-helix domain-containing protein [Holosporales bacterium]